MAREQAVDVLNRLLAAEYESVVPRLGQADPYVSLRSAADGAELSAILRDVEGHERDLIGMILRLRGSPAPRRFATDSGGIHYVKLSHLMPSVLANLRQLIALYESFAGTTGHREADALLGKILDNYRRHLSVLERMHGSPPAQLAK